MDVSRDERYLKILTDRIAVCKRYKPRFGQGGDGVSLTQFQALYSADPFYTWFGLDTPLMYAAHKAAGGGITSVYRQIGLGSEVLFRQILQDELGLTAEQVNWSYSTVTSAGMARTLKLDARIESEHISDVQRRQIFVKWLQKAAAQLQLEPSIAQVMQGIVVEVRQGYKSKDSKRQNADMANAAEACIKGFLPVIVMLSTQIDGDIVERYERGKWLVLRGSAAGGDTLSTYTFIRDIVGYDLAAFFERNSPRLNAFTREVLESLLRADDDT